MGRTKKELGLDSMGIQKSMRLTDYLGDGIGQLPLNIMSSLVGQLTYFYTEKVGLAAGMVATMLLIAKIFDAFSDLAMGKIMDAGRSPKGKCRPWFSRMAIPALVAIILLFTVPKNIGSGFQAAYVLITNVLITAIVYTAVAIPYGALMAIRTESFEERGKMGIFRTAFGYIAGMVIAILLIPITNMLGGTQSAWIKVAVVFGLISLLSLMILYKVTRENVQIAEKSEDDDVPFVEAIKMLFKNKYWVIMLALQFMINISYSLTTSGGTYYAKYVLADENMFGTFAWFINIPLIIALIFTPTIVQKWNGMYKLNKYSYMVATVGRLLVAVAGYMGNIPLMLAFTALAALGQGPWQGDMNAVIASCSEYSWLTKHKHVDGIMYSCTSLGVKIGGGLGTAIVGLLLDFSGFKGTLTVQPDSAINMLHIMYLIVPFALDLIITFILSKMNVEKANAEIKEKLGISENEVVMESQN